MSFPAAMFKGVVARYATALDLATSTMLTEVDIGNPGHILYPRSYAHVTLDLVRHAGVLIVPVAAVSGIGKSPEVLTVQHGRLTGVPVTTGISDGNDLEITSGLSADAAVVATFSSALNPGQNVNYVVAKGGDAPNAS